MRRLFAIILTLILLLTLCELHICTGEGCLFCARAEEVRRDSACISACILLCVLFVSVRLSGFVRRSFRFHFEKTLFDLKVELTD